MNLKRKKINILGLPIDSFTTEQSLRFIEQKLKSDRPIFITTINSEFLFRALNDQAVFKVLSNSTLNIADGIGILWAAKFLSLKMPKNKNWRVVVAFLKLLFSLAAIIFYPRYLKKPIPERISGSDYIWNLAKMAVKYNLRLFLLGAGPTVAEQAALKLQTDIYNLSVAGTFAGTPSIDDEKKIVKIIKNLKADMLFVAYGVPAEELWLARNLGKTGAKIGIGVGGTFDFLAGRKPRAPKFIRAIGLEWLYRLIIEPGRFRRQLALPKFVWRIFKYKLQTIDK